MVVVIKQKNEPEDRLIMRFKKKIIESGLIDEIKARKEYKPKSQLKKEKLYRVRFLRKLEKKRNA